MSSSEQDFKGGVYNVILDETANQGGKVESVDGLVDLYSPPAPLAVLVIQETESVVVDASFDKEAALSDVDSFDHITHMYQKESEEVNESPLSDLQDNPCECNSLEVETKVETQQIFGSLDESGVIQYEQIKDSGAADCESQETEIQKVSFKKPESVVVGLGEVVDASHDTEAALSDVDSSDHITHMYQNESEEVNESLLSDSQDSPFKCNSLEVENKVATQQFYGSSGVIQYEQIEDSGAVDCESQETEIQKGSLKEPESVVVGLGEVVDASHDTEAALSDVDSSDHITHMYQNESEEVNESLLSDLQDNPFKCNSVEVENKVETQQFFGSSGVIQYEQIEDSGAVDCASQETEIQKASLKDESLLSPNFEAEGCLESEIHVTNFEASESDQGCDGGKNFLEDTKVEFLSEPKEKQDAIAEQCENGQFEVDDNFGTEEPGKECACRLYYNGENGNDFPVLSVNDSVLEGEEFYQHIDDSVKPFESHPSPTILDTSIPAFSFVIPETNLDAAKLFEDSRTKLLPKPNENHVAIAELSENGHFEVDHGPGAEVSRIKSDLGRSFNENGDCLPVLSVSDCLLERKEPYQHGGDIENPVERLPSFSISDSPTLASSCVKPETGIAEKPGQSSENVPDTDIFLRDVVPESKDIDALAVESIESASYISKDKKLDKQSSVADTTITISDQVAEMKNSVGGEANSSSPEKTGRLENEIPACEKVYDISCNGNSTDHSSVEHIPGIELGHGIVDSEGETTTFHADDVDTKNEDVLVIAERVDLPTVAVDTKSDFKQEISSVIGSNASSSDVFIADGGFSGCPVIDGNPPNLASEIPDVENREVQISSLDVNMNENLIVVEERHDMEKSNVTAVEISDADCIVGQDMGSESLVKPFLFLVKMPRFDDLIIREQVRRGQLLVEEKTQLRDAFRIDIKKYKEIRQMHALAYETAVSESRASKKAVKSKRAEIDSIQSLINKVKNALSIEDIDARIANMEYMIGHETLPLKEEKQFIREIKQLKQLREQFSSNIGGKDEVQQALNNRDQIEGRLKVLKKELEGLKYSVLKSEAVARAVEKNYEGETRKLMELQAQFKAASNVREEAYVHMQNLKKEMYAKNQRFHTYKDDASAAYDKAAKREIEELHKLCFNQVESTMELWNKNPDFRKDYVRCNVRSTVRRLGTYDGRSLGPDENPPLVVGSYVQERVHRSVDGPSNPASEPPAEIVLQECQVEPIEVVAQLDDKYQVNDAVLVTVEAKTRNCDAVLVTDEAKTRNRDAILVTDEVKTRNQEKLHLGDGVGADSGLDVSNDKIEQEQLLNKEELERAKKEEEQRKAETEANLREQRRLEEKVKALEALERKKKNAEKSQMRAELRAQKEAELREKEKEKRLKKKERKKGNAAEAPDASNSGDTIVQSESVRIEEPEIKDNAAAVGGKKAQKQSQFAKQNKAKAMIPPPLRNRGRKKLQQWIWVIATCFVVVLIFLVGNIGFFTGLSNNFRRPAPGYNY